MRRAMTSEIKQSTSLLGWDLINDLSALPENEEIIIDFLLKRLQRGQIYTWVGSLLLTINPHNEVSTSHLYNPLEFDKYLNLSEAIYEADPHIFTVAAKAHYSLTRELGRNYQVIIISGKTGTGKTFNACKCLEFLSKINKYLASPFQGDYTHNIMLRITDACRLISAFTTACTEKNEVSSRHGQLVQLHYKDDTISGATINSFLLERSRVTRGSNNFQIFYQMIFGMSCTELKTFNLSKDEYYDILNVVDYSKKRYFQESFQDTLKALDVLNFKLDQKKNIFQVLALMIHLGNIKFVEDGEICTIDFSNKKSKEALKSTCILSSLTEEAVIELLTTILINPQSSWRKHTMYHRHLVTIDACRNRLHSIIRHMYDLLFHWILNHANNALSVKHEYSKWLGILDIFGFESFTKNGIEQLCVNYANEKMQKYFIETYLESNRKDLEDEGLIENSNSQYAINLYKERLNVIEEGLFLTLNDICQSPVTINVSTTIQLACQNLYNEQKKFLNEKEGNFIIEHYSGPVAYSIEDLLSKNTDKVPSEISVIFNLSKNKFLRSLMNIEEEQHLDTIKTSTKKRTMLAKLKYNIDTLIKELSKCDLHYVRCVKPNRLKNNEWDREDFRKQLACIGIFDTLPLAKCKYPIRLCYQNFCQRYSKKSTGTIDINKCKMILESVVPKKELHTLVHFGKQLIFLTESIFFKLESCRKNYRVKCANKIKMFWIKHRHKNIPVISKYSTSSYQVQNEYKINKNVTPVKIMLDCELNKSTNSEEEDDVFINNTDPKNSDLVNHPNCITENKQEVNTINTSENLDEFHTENKNNTLKNKLNVSEKLQHDFENQQKNNTDFKYQFRDIHIENCLTNNTTKFTKKIDFDQFLKSEYYKGFYRCNSNIDVNYNDNNNNSVRQHLGPIALHISLTNTGFAESSEKQICSMHYDMEESVYTIQMESFTLFYKNGILSRRRLAAIPIKLHTRPTCLINSHILPHELPKGLQDCL